MLYLLVFFSSLITTIILTPFLINFFTRFNIVDIPGGRHINESAIPRMGGILIYFIILFTVLAYSKEPGIVHFIAPASALFALCGVVDDIKNLKWHLKFMLHSFSAVIILYYLYPLIHQVEFFGSVLPAPFDIIILFLFITGAVNSVNMLDGMDGLVSGISLLIFMLIFMLSFSIGDTFLMVISAACIGSLVGFLKFNANPARIFLGDTGSLTLGFFLVISVLLLTLRMEPQVLDLGFPIILLGIPLIDTLRVMTVRLWNGKSPFIADSNHLHHMISGNNIRHKTTVFIIQAFTIVFIVLSITYLYYDRFTAYVLFCISALVLFNLKPLMHLLKETEKFKTVLGVLFRNNIFTVDLYKKYLLPFSAVTVAALLIILFPRDAKLSTGTVVLMLVICGLLVAASYLSIKREHSLNDIYVLINLLIFFSLTNFTEPWLHFNSLWGENILFYLTAYSVTGIVLLFVIMRYRLFHDGRVLFSGLDMTIIVMFIFLIITNNMLNIRELNFIGGNIVLGFTIYIWYKIASFVIPAFTRPAYYFSFALPLITLIIISL